MRAGDRLLGVRSSPSAVLVGIVRPAVSVVRSSTEERRGSVEATTSERYASGGPAPELPAQNLIKAFQASAERLGDEIAIRDEARGVELSWNDVGDRMRRIAGGLSKLGLGKGDTVAIMLNNRHEFIPCDLAAVSLGAIPFSIYQTSAPEQIRYLLSDAKSKIAIVEQAFLDRIEEARKDLPELGQVIVVDGEGGDHTLEAVMEMDPDFDVDARADQLQPDDMLTLIYTSGTTGPPKGVQLTHRNLMCLTGGIDDLIHFPSTGAKVISWLPAAHIAERGAHYYLPVIRGV